MGGSTVRSLPDEEFLIPIATNSHLFSILSPGRDYFDISFWCVISEVLFSFSIEKLG